MPRNEQDFLKVGTDARASFEREGVVCLRGVIGGEWLRCCRRGIEEALQSPGPFFRDQTPEGSPARYVFDYWNWRNVPAFRKLVLQSPFARMIASLLGARELYMLMDNWFLREAGATNGAPWHHDEPYFDFFGGRKCVLWFPLESASRDEGLTFLGGSHRWGRLYMPQNFREHEPFAGDLSGYYEMEDFEGYRDRFLSWDLEPGDCLVFDFRTLHRATNRTDPLPRTIHRMSLRYGDQDVVFKPRGEWTRETSAYLVEQGQRPFETPRCRLTPLVYPGQSETA
jgi:ectoine hydroxylase-related dioxygenase (phytanoyl-CoA dioxygenase family)